jgi:hypothetical protein
MAARRVLSCLLIAGMAVPVVALADPASADTSVHGIVVDTGYSDGLLLNGDSSQMSPTYDVTTVVAGATTTFRTRSVSTGTYNGPDVSVTPPTGAATLAPGHYATAGVATDTLAGLALTRRGSCNSTSEGTLDVTDVAYAAGQISSFAGSWSYRCTGGTSWSYGEVRFASAAGVVSGTQTRFLSLDSVGVGQTTTAKSTVVRNNGTLPLTLGTAHFTGKNPGDFAVTTDGCSGQSLAVGATCSVAVAATPSAVGNRDAVLELPDASARGFRRTQVFASGLAPASAPLDVVAEQAVDGTYIDWRPPADNGGGDITSYQVLRGTSPDALLVVGTSTRGSYGDALSETTLPATTYYYAVKAVTAAGAGAASTIVSVTTPDSAGTPPTTKVLSVGVEAGSAPYTQSGRVLTAGVSGTTIDVTTNFPGAQFTSSIPADGHSRQAVYVNPPSGSRLAVGTFSLGTGGYSVGLTTPEGANCGFKSGSVTLSSLSHRANGTLAVADIDATGTCESGNAFAQVRVGTDRGYDGTSISGIDSGPVAVNSVATGITTLTNTGTRSLHISSVDVGGDWTLSTPDTCTGADIAPGASCSTTLEVQPTETGARTSAVAFHDDNGTTVQRRDVTALGTSVPVAPTYLAAYRSSNKVTVSWDDPGKAHQRATSVEVLRGTSEADAVVIGTEPVTGLGTKTFQDPDTSDGLRWYGVRGINVAGTGATSSITVDVGLRAPTVKGAAGASLVGIQWMPASSLPGDEITGWRVYRGSSAGSLAAAGDVTTTEWYGPAPAAGTHVYLAVAPLVGSTLGPRSDVVNLVATASQLVTASSLDVVHDGDLFYALPNPSYPVRVRTLDGAPVASLHNPSPSSVHALEVAVNPRGNQVVYTQNSDGADVSPNELWIRNLDGSGTPTMLRGISEPKAGLAWSPDGTTIAYGRRDYSGNNPALYTISTRGVASKVPGSASLTSPSWLDGTTLVARDISIADGGLVRINVSTGARSAVAGTAGALSPAASPDGKQVAYSLTADRDGHNALKVITLATGVVRGLPMPEKRYFGRAAWTKDAQRLFLTDGAGLFEVLADGSATGTYTETKDERIASVAVSTPDTAGPTGTKLGGIPAYTLGTSVTPTFAATDTGSGVLSYTVSYRKATMNTAFSAPTTLTLTLPKAIAVAKGYTYCFSVKATDRVYNASGATAEQCTVVPMDDRSLVRSSKFTPVTSSAYYASTAMRATAKGATLTRTGVTSARQLFLVVTTCRTCGTLDVLVGAGRVAAVNLYSAKTVNKKVIALPAFSTRSGTVTLRVTSTSKTVIVDGLGIRK